MDYENAKQKCNVCNQHVTGDILYRGYSLKSYSEKIALRQNSLSSYRDLAIIEDKDVASFKVTDFAVYDRFTHLCPIDTGLIEKGVSLYFSGYIKSVDDENPSVENGVPVCKAGPIKEWWIYGYDGTDISIIGLTTDVALYYLMQPSSEYSSIFKNLNERVKLSKRVIEFLLDFGHQNPTFEDLIDHLKNFNEFPEVEELLLREAQFICNQVISYDEETIDEDVAMIEYSCIQSLIELTGVKITKQRNAKRFEDHKNKYPCLSTRITTTTLVRDVFERFQFEQHLSVDNSMDIKIHDKPKMCRSDDNDSEQKEIQNTTKNPLENHHIRCQELNSSIIEDDELGTKPTKHKECAKQILHSVEWINRSTEKYNDCQGYSSASVGNFVVHQGDFVMLQAEELNEPLRVAVVSYMYDSPVEGPMFHAHFFCRGTDTILGNTANPRELFVVDDCDDYPIGCILQKTEVKFLKSTSHWKDLGGKMGLPVELDDNGLSYFFSKIYDYEFSQFRDYNEYRTSNSNPPCMSCRWQREIKNSNTPMLKDDNCILWRNETFNIGCAVFLEPGQEKYVPESVKEDETYKIDENLYPEIYRKNTNILRGSSFNVPEPFTVGLIEDIKAQPNDIKIKVRMFYRPEDTQGPLLSPYIADINYIYWSNQVIWTPFKNVAGKCYISYTTDIEQARKWCEKGPFRFYYTEAYNHKTFKLFEVPLEGRLLSDELKQMSKRNYNLRSNNQKLSNDQNKLMIEIDPKWPQMDKPLRCMDIYAGCGGLSVGLHQSGVAYTLWAIEKEVAPAQAFQLNNPNCNVFTEDCNDILKKLLDGKGQVEGLPNKGEVELLIGGPPCQGFSVLNRFNSGQDSFFKNSQILTFLGFCDYYRPKYLVLENVRNFVSFKRGTVFKLTLKALLAMNYQVSFGILQAGQFGIPQSRRRFILIGAAPGCTLPNLPEPLHVFSKSGTSLSIVVDGLRYDTGNQWNDGLPYRTICVKDAIADLPKIENGSGKIEMPYEELAKSYFQRYVRKSNGLNELLKDHVCKELSPLVEARISHIPIYPGADWRDLPNKAVQLKDDSMTKILIYHYRKKGQNKIEPLRGVCKCAMGYKCDPADKQSNTLIPWCLSHTADRNNNWVALYGRLEWAGYFGTTVTNPEPMGTQGRVLHPEQNRVVSVRECARSQGFHDNYKFCGNVLEKHRQIGNAVPPPLALSLGREIIKAHNSTKI